MSGRRYEVLEPIGRGGFGTVYKARFVGEAGFSRLVVLKVLKPGMADIEEVAQRLRDEARMLGHVQHRAVVRVDRLARLGGRWAVVMEYVDGVTLVRLTHHQPIPPGPALEILSEVASGLQAALLAMGPDGRPLNLLHRDIKPTNIMVTTDGDVKVLDFGIARSDGQREAFTRSLMFGTPEYMSPERFELTDTPAGDVYAMGLVLFELLIGAPLGRTSPRPVKHNALMDRALETLEHHGVPAQVASFIMEMLAFEPEDRPTTSDVERRAARLAKEVGGDGLRFWAREAIPPLLSSSSLLPDDELRGAVLEESGFTGPSPPDGWGGDYGGTPVTPRQPTPLPAPVTPYRPPTPMPSPVRVETPAAFAAEIAAPRPDTSAGTSRLTLAVAGTFAALILLCGGAGLGGWKLYQRNVLQVDQPADPANQTAVVLVPEPDPKPPPDETHSDPTGTQEGTGTVTPKPTDDGSKETPKGTGGTNNAGSGSKQPETPPKEQAPKQHTDPPPAYAEASAESDWPVVQLGDGPTWVLLKTDQNQDLSYKVEAGHPKRVRPGSYVIQAQFPQMERSTKAGRLEVIAGMSVKITCDTVRKMCDGDKL